MTVPQLRERLLELIRAQQHLKTRIATERPLDHKLIRLHMYACNEVAEARRELEIRTTISAL